MLRVGDQVRVLHYPVPSIGSSPTRARGMGRSTLDVMLGTGTLVAGYSRARDGSCMYWEREACGGGIGGCWEQF